MVVQGTVGRIVERQQELNALDSALASARDGVGRLLYVEGHAGIGKSSLLEEAIRKGAEGGMAVLTAHASELERGHSFGVVRQLFEARLKRADAEEREDLLAGVAGLVRPMFERGTLSTGSPEEQLFRALHGLYWLTSNLAERSPVLIAADDAHWSDQASLRFFLYLAQRLEDLPVALVTAARPAEPGAPNDLLRQLKTAAVTRVLRPAALSPDGVAAVVGRRAPDAAPEFAAACRRLTGGNPYLLTELLADVEQKGLEPSAEYAKRLGRMAPESVLHAAVERLGCLPAGARELARSVAVLGESATLHRASALADLDLRVAGRAADALIAADLLKPGRPLSFVHPLIRSAVYEELSVADRGERHGKAARLLAESAEADETIAAHLLLATRAGDAWVVDRLRRAGRLAIAQGAPDSAVGYLRRALEEPVSLDARPEVLLELGRAESAIGRADAIARFEEALGLIDDPRRRAEVLRELGWALQKSGDMRSAVTAFERGLTELASGPDADEAERANLRAAHLGAALLDPESTDRAQARLRAMRASRHERQLLELLAARLTMAGEPHEEAISLALDAWDGGALLEEQGSDSHAIWPAVATLAYADALEPAEAILEAVIERARREGAIVTLAMGFYVRSWPRFWQGDLAGCVADAEAAISAWSGEFGMYLPVAAYWCALARIELDDVPGAAAVLELPRAKERWGRTNMYGGLLAARAQVAMVRGRAREAIGLLEEGGEALLAAGIANPAVVPWRAFLSEARLAAGDRDGARAAAMEELELTRRYGAARPIGVALRAAGLAEGGATGIELLEEAVATLRRSPSQLELTRALVDLGGAVRRAARPAEARRPLREGLELADRLGAVRLARKAREELLASGARPRRRELTGPAALTPGELRVATLAASGMTNREIAQNLFVTVKAVQWHLRNAYRKLGVGGRDELARALATEPTA